MAFIDEVKLQLSSGKGGPGCVSFRRESHVPRGGPDGGDGGRGGHIIFKATSRLNSLIAFQGKKKFFAKNGEPGSGSNCTGKDGEDIVLEVPPGTIIKCESGDTLFDLSEGDEIVFLEGGMGGKGNSFYKNSVNQAPEIAQKGMPGTSKTVHVELKLIADVGLVGFPNVGKSTLISHLSSAKPKVADYPFTTLTPNLGVVKISNEESFVLADIPGIIEGAHEGVGLGLKFLRHIDRTAAFVHLIDASEHSGRDPIEDYHAINNELEKYSGETLGTALHKRIQLVVLNKMDSVSPQRMFDIQARFKALGVETEVISAVTGQNVEPLKFKIYELVKKVRGLDA